MPKFFFAPLRLCVRKVFCSWIGYRPEVMAASQESRRNLSQRRGVRRENPGTDFPGLLLLSMILLAYTAMSARQTEINYGD
jgi:hypothetical protein